jgi:hypothetical protein
MSPIPKDPTKDKIIDLIAIVTSAAPALGGPISAILSGYVTRRKFERMSDAITTLAEILQGFKNEASEAYVATEDFEDLLDNTLRRIATERAEAKRILLRNFLAVSIRECNSNYDDLERILRIVDQMQPDHLIILHALDQAPSSDNGISGSPRQTLRSRIPSFDDSHIKDLVEQLNDLRITNLTSLGTMMTARGAQELSAYITPIGRKVMKYLQ